MPKILQMPKRHEHGLEDNAACATSRKPPPAENVGQPNPSENHPDHATIARWLKLADELLVENNDRKKA